MPTEYRTPGVYVTETGAFPSSAIGVETAVPCFIGHTERSPGAEPRQIGSLAEFVQFFGGRHTPHYYLAAPGTALPSNDLAVGEFVLDLDAVILVRAAGPRFLLYDSIRLFFANGGERAWIVSCGSYDAPVSLAPLLAGIATANLPGPTMLAMPDAALLAATDRNAAAVALTKAAGDAGDRMALLDVGGLDTPAQGWEPDVADFRAAIATLPEQARSFAAAYFPPLRTSIVAPGEIDADWGDPRFVDPAAASVRAAIAAAEGVLPPSGAIAGIWCATDANRGVWKAPANIGITAATGLLATMSAEQQADLNAPADGLSVNAMRLFPGQGILVWGARTLDGNSGDWRYISVRRTAIYVEQSVKATLQSLVFEPNTAITWTTARAMIENFLVRLWREGALAGATPAEAFAVEVGLGATMTADDIMDGVMRIQVQIAITRPAEFIVLTFQQEMQTST